MTKLKYYSTLTQEARDLKRIRETQRLEVSGLVANGMTPEDAAELVGADLDELGELTADGPFVPTPAMIRAACERLQRTWPANRFGKDDEPAPWTPPVCRTSEIWEASRDAG